MALPDERLRPLRQRIPSTTLNRHGSAVHIRPAESSLNLANCSPSIRARNMGCAGKVRRLYLSSARCSHALPAVARLCNFLPPYCYAHAPLLLLTFQILDEEPCLPTVIDFHGLSSTLTTCAATILGPASVGGEAKGRANENDSDATSWLTGRPTTAFAAPCQSIHPRSSWNGAGAVGQAP